MSEVLTIVAFVVMVLAPCFVASHATLGEEDFTLGYASSFRDAKAWLISVLRV